MKRIDLAKTATSLPQVLRLAGEEDVVLQTRDGRHFVLAEIDDFDAEIAAVAKNRALLKLLRDRSKETATVSLAEARARLNGRKRKASRR